MRLWGRGLAAALKFREYTVILREYSSTATGILVTFYRIIVAIFMNYSCIFMDYRCFLRITGQVDRKLVINVGWVIISWVMDSYRLIKCF